MPCLAAAPPPLARVNGEPIYEADLQGIGDENESRERRLERLVLFRLAVQEARRAGIEKDAQAKKEIERALYRRFLEKTLEASGRTLVPSEKELRAAYEATPLVRLRHLALFIRNDRERQDAERKLSAIRKALASGRDFKSLVLEHSQDPGARFAGDLDFRGVHNLPGPIYEAALRLAPDQVSEPIRFDGALHLVQRIDRQSFDSAPATYKSLLENRLRREAESRALESRLAALKKAAKIEILEGNGSGGQP